MEELYKNWKNYINERKSQKQVVLKFPKLRISEQWGTPGSDDRKIIEMFTSRIKGKTLSEKINTINSFVSDCDEACASGKDVSEILASMVFLDSLASVIYDFNDKTGGYLFESLLAALFGKTANQIPTLGGKDQDVTDIIDDQGRRISLKFFFEGASQYIKGSYKNLQKEIKETKKPITYVVAIKNRTAGNNVVSIDFYEFTVGSRKYRVKGDFDAKDVGAGDPEAEGKYGYSSKNGLGISYIKNDQFHIGNLNMGGSREKLKELAQKFTDKLGSSMTEIYNQIDMLSNNVNEYYLSSPKKKNAALKAQQNANSLKKETEELL